VANILEYSKFKLSCGGDKLPWPFCQIAKSKYTLEKNQIKSCLQEEISYFKNYAKTIILIAHLPTIATLKELLKKPFHYGMLSTSFSTVIWQKKPKGKEFCPIWMKKLQVKHQ